MVVFLAAWGMCFAALFFAYAIVRMRASEWPPDGVPTLPVALPAFNTLLLAASSYTFHRGLVAVRADRVRALVPWLSATAALGVAFLVLQLVVWLGVHAAGLDASSTLYGSIFYGLTVFHALHVLSAIAILGYLIPCALRDRYSARSHTAVRMGALFWHFVDAIWFLMFVSIYLV